MGSGIKSKTKAVEKSIEEGKTNAGGSGVSLEVTATVGEIKGGISLGFDAEASWSSSIRYPAKEQIRHTTR